MKFSHFKRLVKKFSRYLMWLIIVFVAVTVLLRVAVLVILLSLEHSGQLDKWIKRGTGWDVQYQKIHIGVHDLNPTIVLKNVVLKDPKDVQAEFDLQKLEVDLAVWSTLIERMPVTAQIIISGLNLDVEELPNEEWRVNGMLVGAPSQNSDLLKDVLVWLLNQKAIGVDHLSVHLAFLNGKVYDFQPVNLSWYGKQHHVRIVASMPKLSQSKLDLTVDFFPSKDLTQFSEWQLRFSGHATADDFSPLLSDNKRYDLKFLSGGGRLDFNGLVQQGNLQQLQMGVSLRNLNLTHVNAAPLSINQMDEQVYWQSFGVNNGWSLRIQPVSGAASALGRVGVGMLTISNHPNDPQHIWELTANDIDLGILGQWVNFAFTTNTDIEKIWDVLSPGGTIQNLQIISGAEQGTLSFTGKNLDIDSNEVFLQGWPKFSLAFGLVWQKTQDNKNWQIKFDHFNMQNEHLNVNVAGGFNVPLADPRNPYFNLTATLQGTNLGSEIRDYIPQNLSPGLVHWLEQGLVAFPVVNADLTWRGKLQDVPYADKAHPGVFHVAVNATNATIQPWLNWPVIKDLDAKMLINNQRFTIDAVNAKTGDVTLQQLHFELADMRPGNGIPIVITGTAKPTGAQALAYLASMPVVAPRVQDVLKNQMRLTGDVPLTLKVIIPRHHRVEANTVPGVDAQGEAKVEEAPVMVTGTATLAGNNLYRLNGKQNVLWFSQIKGVLNFVNQNLSSPQFNFVFKDLPFQTQIIESPVDNLHFLVPEVRLYGQNFKAVNVFVQPPPANTQGVIKNPIVTFKLNDENVVGTIVLEPNGSLNARLDQWTLVPQVSSPSGTEVQKAKVSRAVDTAASVPSDYLKHLGRLLSEVPTLDLVVKRFYYGADDLGTLTWRSDPMVDGIDIEHFTLGDDDASLDLAGSIVTRNNQDEISMAGQLTGNNFGNALTQLGYPNVVDSGSGTIKFELNWMGALFHPEWTTFQGNFNFDVRNGKFLKVNTGLAQILGLLSLNTVVSTFSLDFKGIFSGGLPFSSIEGNYLVQNGVAHTSDLRIEGATVNVQVKGDINLVNNTVDQVLVIQPQVGTSFAIAATVLGGPIAGAATFVANEVLNKTVLKNTGFMYRITGPLDKPVATPLALPSGGSTS